MQAHGDGAYSHNMHPPQQQSEHMPYVDNTIRTSTIFMSKTASIAYLELQGVNGRKFYTNENAMRSILLPAANSKTAMGVQEGNNLLRRVHVHRVVIEAGSRNQFPFPLGVHIVGIDACEYTLNGEAFNYIIPANYTVQTSKCIFESFGDEKLMSDWESDFARWNTDNLGVCLCARCVEVSCLLCESATILTSLNTQRRCAQWWCPRAIL